MPLCDSSTCWMRKAHRTRMFILRVGNIFEQLIIFSLDSLRTFVRMITVGVKAVTSGCRGQS